VEDPAVAAGENAAALPPRARMEQAVMNFMVEVRNLYKKEKSE
jgi:hypothetical protein